MQGLGLKLRHVGLNKGVCRIWGRSGMYVPVLKLLAQECRV